LIEALADEPSFVPDVYFTDAYGRVDALDQGGDWASIATRSGTWQMPIVLAALGDGLREATSPYGYSGIHVGDDLTAADAADAWSSSTAILRDLGVVSLFLRFSPFEPRSVRLATTLDGVTVRRSGTTYLVRTDDPADMWDRMEGRSRTAIRKARQHGLTGMVRPVAREDLDPGSDFRTLYEGTMLRVGAADRYIFDDGYYRGLMDALGAGLQVVEVREDGAVVASALMMRHGTRAHYHLSGSDPEASRRGANTMLVWTMVEWCAGSDVETCHLGGGVSEGDGLAVFKRSFGGQEAAFHVGQAIIDPVTYARLTRERATQLATTAAALEQADYFPAFRAGGG
jgi:hypothetical protein